jgi:hypothetical protein
VFSSAALAEDAQPVRARGDLGIRYWLSTGENKHSHNAQGLFPSTGNPTSVLTYQNLDANVVELFGREIFARDWFLKGNLGWGRINTGSFRDEDFFAGQVKFSDTTSSVPSGWLAYGSIDVGRQWVLREGGVRLGVFAGYSQWSEYVDAYGATDTIDGSDNIGRDVKVISNKVIWKALRVGFAGEVGIGSRTWLSLDLAAIPYAKVRNEDSHHLRTDPDDLGPVPNIIIEGRRGYGVQADAELRYEIFRRTELGLGVRYWYLRSTDGERKVVDFPDLPIVEIYSRRSGATLSLRRTW